MITLNGEERMLNERKSPSLGVVLRAGVLVLALAAAGLFAAGTLSAEPYFSVRDGYKCSKCHVNKTGGGARTDYAQVYMQTRMVMQATPRSEGEAVGVPNDFQHGQLNDFVKVGADVRARVSRINPENSDPHWNFGRREGASPSCAACHGSSGGGKKAEMNLQLEPMPGKVSLVVTQSFLPGPATREAYGLLENLPLEGYVKAGVFHMPTGLQNTWDDPFIHGDTHPEAQIISRGTTGVAGLTPTRGEGVEFGVEPGPFSVSMSLTNPNNTAIEGKVRRHMQAYAVGDLGLFGLTHYVEPLSVSEDRTFSAAFGGISLGRITALAEVDRLSEDSGDTTTDAQALLGELDILISRGQNLKLVYEQFDPDLDQEQDMQDRQSIIYEPFLTRYFQVRAGYRKNMGPNVDPPDASPVNSQNYFLELHFMF